MDDSHMQEVGDRLVEKTKELVGEVVRGQAWNAILLLLVTRYYQNLPASAEQLEKDRQWVLGAVRGMGNNAVAEAVDEIFDALMKGQDLIERVE